MPIMVRTGTRTPEEVDGAKEHPMVVAVAIAVQIPRRMMYQVMIMINQLTTVRIHSAKETIQVKKLILRQTYVMCLH